MALPLREPGPYLASHRCARKGGGVRARTHTRGGYRDPSRSPIGAPSRAPDEFFDPTARLRLRNFLASCNCWSRLSWISLSRLSSLHLPVHMRHNSLTRGCYPALAAPFPPSSTTKRSRKAQPRTVPPVAAGDRTPLRSGARNLPGGRRLRASEEAFSQVAERLSARRDGSHRSCRKPMRSARLWSAPRLPVGLDSLLLALL